MGELLWKDEVYAVVGAAMEVYNTMGSGFLEAVYQEALGLELSVCGIPFVPQHQLRIFYKQHRLDKFYIADFLAFDRVIVEIKALDHMGGREDAQLLNYLKATGMQVGVLINFGSRPKLEWKRMVRTQ